MSNWDNSELGLNEIYIHTDRNNRFRSTNRYAHMRRHFQAFQVVLTDILPKSTLVSEFLCLSKRREAHSVYDRHSTRALPTVRDDLDNVGYQLKLSTLWGVIRNRL